MHKYRLYVYDAEDRQIAPAMVIAADNDDAATEQAKNMLDGVRAELTDDDRLVMRFPKDQRPARLFSYPNPKNHNYSDHQDT